MKNAFDSEGFYRTGGIGKLENDIIYILGRASQDGKQTHASQCHENILIKKQ